MALLPEDITQINQLIGQYFSANLQAVKLSTLPLASTLEGLHTMGVDASNNSVRVSLQFVKDATTQASDAADLADQKAAFANGKALLAIEAAEAANTAAAATKPLRFIWDETRLGLKFEGDPDFVYTDLKGATGNSLEFAWNGTRLGVRVEGQPAYTEVELGGKDAYQIALALDPTIGTEEEWIQSLKQPALDAAEAADAARLAIQNDLAAKAAHGYGTEPQKTLKEVDDSVSQLAGDVNELGIKDAVQGAKIKDIENVLSTANINQTTTLSVMGRKVVSLPKNASNGGMQVKLEGLTAENLVANGDFRNGLTGWTTYSGGTPVVESGYIKYTPPSLAGAGAMSNGLKQLSVGDKWYVRTIIKSSSPVACAVGFAKSQVGTLVVTGNIGTSDTTISGILTIANADINEFVVGRPTVVQDIYIKNASAINLTQIFGSGNEPDLATCNAMFSDYFEGRKNFVPTGRVRSVGKNLFPEFLELGTINQTTGANTASTTEARTPKIPFSDGMFRSSAPSGYRVLRVFMYDRSGLFLGLQLLATTSAVYQTMASTRYIRVTFDKSAAALTSTDIDTLKQGIQIEKGSIQTSYTKYVDTHLYLTAPELRSNGLVKDEIRKGANGYELVKRISEVDGTVLATPVISPISHGGILNSAANGTVYHEPVIADAGVYGTNMPILLTDYPIASIEEIIKHENGVDTYLDVSTAVIAGDKLSFTHPSLQSGDLVLFTYAFSKESTNGQLTATFFDSNVVKIDTVTGKAYKITDVVTNGVLTRTLTEV